MANGSKFARARLDCGFAPWSARRSIGKMAMRGRWGRTHSIHGRPGPRALHGPAPTQIKDVVPHRRVCSARDLPKVLREIFKDIPEPMQKLIMEFSKHRWEFQASAVDIEVAQQL